jgi:hypothetical protein
MRVWKEGIPEDAPKMGIHHVYLLRWQNTTIAINVTGTGTVEYESQRHSTHRPVAYAFG